MKRAGLVLVACLALAPAAMAQTRTLVLQPTRTLAAAQTVVGEVVYVPQGVKALAVQSVFAYGAGGTTTKAYLQTSLDGGATWIDIAQHAFVATAARKVSAVRMTVAMAGGYAPTDGTLADDTIKDGLLGDRIRAKYIVDGTYTGASSITITAVVN